MLQWYYSLEPPEPIDDHLLPFGLSVGDQRLRSVDDGSSEPQITDDPFPLFGVEQDTIWVINNRSDVIGKFKGSGSFHSSHLYHTKKNFCYTVTIIQRRERSWLTDDVSLKVLIFIYLYLGLRDKIPQAYVRPYPLPHMCAAFSLKIARSRKLAG